MSFGSANPFANCTAGSGLPHVMRRATNDPGTEYQLRVPDRATAVRMGWQVRKWSGGCRVMITPAGFPVPSEYPDFHGWHPGTYDQAHDFVRADPVPEAATDYTTRASEWAVQLACNATGQVGHITEPNHGSDVPINFSFAVNLKVAPFSKLYDGTYCARVSFVFDFSISWNEESTGNVRWRAVDPSIPEQTIEGSWSPFTGRLSSANATGIVDTACELHDAEENLLSQIRARGSDFGSCFSFNLSACSARWSELHTLPPIDFTA